MAAPRWNPWKSSKVFLSSGWEALEQVKAHNPFCSFQGPRDFTWGHRSLPFPKPKNGSLCIFLSLCLPDAVVIVRVTGRISSQWQPDKIFPAVPQCALQAELNNNHKESFLSCSEPHQCTTYPNPMHQGSKEEHKQLHCGHGILEELPSVILLLISRGAGPGMPWWPLVFSLVDKGTAAPSPAGASVSSKSAIAAVLGSLQQHPVKSVKKLCFSYSKLILMSCMEKCITISHRVPFSLLTILLRLFHSCTAGWTSNSQISIWKLKFYN